MARPTSPTGLNATSASLLGLLAIDDWPRPWTSYELTKQAQRSLHWFWPRAQRQLFGIPKKLVAFGYAQAHDHATGKRTSTRYTITDQGRAALRAWLTETGQCGVLIEAEELLRVFFGDQGDIEQLRVTIGRIAEEARADRSALAEIVADMDEDATTRRAAVNALSIRLVADIQKTVEQWADWAMAETAEWASPRDEWPQAAQIFAAIAAYRNGDRD